MGFSSMDCWSHGQVHCDPPLLFTDITSLRSTDYSKEQWRISTGRDKWDDQVIMTRNPQANWIIRTWAVPPSGRLKNINAIPEAIIWPFCNQLRQCRSHNFVIEDVRVHVFFFFLTICENSWDIRVAIGRHNHGNSFSPNQIANNDQFHIAYWKLVKVTQDDT